MLQASARKVKFGTPVFLVFRTKINLLVSERNRLKPKYEANKERYNSISRYLRAIAGVVFFEPSKMRKEDSVIMAAADAYKTYQEQRRQRKEKGKKPKNFSYQKGLF